MSLKVKIVHTRDGDKLKDAKSGKLAGSLSKKPKAPEASKVSTKTQTAKKSAKKASPTYKFSTRSYKDEIFSDDDFYSESDDDSGTRTTVKEISLLVNGKKVGYVKIAPIDDDAYIEWLEILPKYRGKGYARKLMQEVYRRTKGTVDWTKTMHPASEHLAKQFQELYPERTEYQNNQKYAPQIAQYRLTLDEKTTDKTNVIQPVSLKAPESVEPKAKIQIRPRVAAFPKKK